jgi:rubrerythrin
MTLISSIVGTKCCDCGRRIKGTKYEVATAESGAAKQFLCSKCYEARNTAERLAQELAGKREREMEERWRLTPDRQVEEDLPGILDSLRLNPDDAAIANLKHFCQRAETYWRGEKILWRTRLNTEKLLTPALSAQVPQIRVFASRLLGIAAFVQSTPALIKLVSAKDDSSVAARSALAALLERLNRGDSTCPRCGYDVENLGPGTPWRCSKCDLSYQRETSHNPATFRANRAVQITPWNRNALLDLLEEVVVAYEGASSDQIRGWSLLAQEISTQRDALLISLGQG